VVILPDILKHGGGNVGGERGPGASAATLAIKKREDQLHPSLSRGGKGKGNDDGNLAEWERKRRGDAVS